MPLQTKLIEKSKKFKIYWNRICFNNLLFSHKHLLNFDLSLAFVSDNFDAILYMPVSLHVYVLFIVAANGCILIYNFQSYYCLIHSIQIYNSFHPLIAVFHLKCDRICIENPQMFELIRQM